LNLLPAHHVRAVPIDAHAGDDRGAAGLDPEQRFAERLQRCGTGQIPRFGPTPIRSDHARQQERDVAEPRAQIRHLGREAAWRNRGHATRIGLTPRHHAIAIEQEDTPVGRTPIDRDKTSALHRHPG